MTRRYLRQEESELKPNPHCSREREINILFLGQSGVGKSTFINAFANYIVNDALLDAVNDEMQVIIASAFNHTDLDTFEDILIHIGNEDECEQFKNVGQSATQRCRSFVFPIGDRNLRFIDTPGIGDTKGIDQDKKNFQEIMNYISQYEHLNAVFILLKPNEERLNVFFRFCINELLRHLHHDAKNNIMFGFTNARTTFFMPGSTKRNLQELLDSHRKEQGVDIPFSKPNTFFFDNEPFRYLALHKNGIRLDDEQTRSYIKSWDHSVKEYSRLMEHINQCPLHLITNTVSLNAAEQLVRKLPRPIAETAKLIEENIQLAIDYKKKVLENPEIALEGIPQIDAVVKPLTYPQTVCCGEQCCRVTGEGNEKKVEYLSICHDRCFLIGVQQETLAHPEIRECEVMDPRKGYCTICNCSWREHKHITYEYDARSTHLRPNTRDSRTTNRDLCLSDIDQRIGDLRNEKRQIEEVYMKLAQFLYKNAMLPINDAYIEYLQYFKREEQMKQNAGVRNAERIVTFEKMIDDYTNEMELYKKILEDQRDLGGQIETIQPREVLNLIDDLYRLPITGQQIREQVEGIQNNQERYGVLREIHVSLPAKAASSKVMLQLRNIVS